MQSNESKEILRARPGDIVKIMIVYISPLDYENPKVARSVSHETLWVKIEQESENGYMGTIKTSPGHKMETMDGSKFAIGDQITFRAENILAVK